MSVRGIRRSVRRRRMYQHQARLYQQMYQQFPPTNHIGAGMICYADSRRTAENPYFTRLYKERQRSSGKWSDLRRGVNGRSEEHTSELQSLMRISYAVFCLKKKNNIHRHNSL